MLIGNLRGDVSPLNVLKLHTDPKTIDDSNKLGAGPTGRAV